MQQLYQLHRHLLPASSFPKWTWHEEEPKQQHSEEGSHPTTWQIPTWKLNRILHVSHCDEQCPYRVLWRELLLILPFYNQERTFFCQAKPWITSELIIIAIIPEIIKYYRTSMDIFLLFTGDELFKNWAISKEQSPHCLIQMIYFASRSFLSVVKLRLITFGFE